MNRMHGTVIVLETEGEISLVEIAVEGARLTSLVLESEASAVYLAAGSPVTAFFKESEVSIAIAPASGLTIRNRIPCSILTVAEGRILSHLTLAWKGGTLHSLITTRALHELRLVPGLRVEALVKATEVSLAEGHAAL
ncbi:MAG TPA: TOBE domain-containing protein [Fibrobacteria bacterium]|nr:TOBE domain-containing protein [Fibrobacteria bacterium]